MALNLRNGCIFKVIAFVTLVITIQMIEVDAFEYRHSIVNLDNKPLISQRFSVNSSARNGSYVQNDVINHVTHNHEQTIGNVRISTKINISNVITILNATSVPPTNATTKPGSIKGNNSGRYNNASVDRNEQYTSLDQDHKDIPFAFPDRIAPELSRRIRWPTDTDHQPHFAYNIESKTGNSGRTVIFPGSTQNSDEMQMIENTKIATNGSNAWQSNETNGQKLDPLVQNSINITTFIVNDTAIESGSEPLIYIDDDGIFQVKYIPKGENISIPSNKQQHSNGSTSASINNTKETSIISNDNQQIPRDHQTSTASNTERLTTTTATIDLIHDGDGANAINKTEIIFQWNGPHSNAPSSKPASRPQNVHQPDNNMPPFLFNGLPIFT